MERTKQHQRRIIVAVNRLSDICHEHARSAGWWTDLGTGLCNKDTRNQAELICLMHSELSEAMEALRKDAMDDKLPHRKGLEVELADALIRIFDFAGAFGLDMGGAMVEKLEYNSSRADHKIESRRSAGGKKF